MRSPAIDAGTNPHFCNAFSIAGSSLMTVQPARRIRAKSVIASFAVGSAASAGPLAPALRPIRFSARMLATSASSTFVACPCKLLSSDGCAAADALAAVGNPCRPFSTSATWFNALIKPVAPSEMVAPRLMIVHSSCTSWKTAVLYRCHATAVRPPDGL